MIRRSPSSVPSAVVALGLGYWAATGASSLCAVIEGLLTGVNVRTPGERDRLLRITLDAYLAAQPWLGRSPVTEDGCFRRTDPM